jgi:hypothetical protein
MQRVLEFGAQLLSSGGQEYDVGVDNTKTPAERLARQKQNLRRRLGNFFPIVFNTSFFERLFQYLCDPVVQLLSGVWKC